MIRFGKPSAALLAQKTHFFRENTALLAEGERIGDIYRRQPRRTRCKCCNFTLDGRRFTKKGTEYVLCGSCGHLNGAFEDTNAFCEAVYTNTGGEAYARTYSSADREAYQTRVREIYLPKAEFLLAGLTDAGEDPEALRYADLGAGSGYFVAALREAGRRDVTGYEVSEVQVALASEMLGAGAVVHHELDDAVKLAGKFEADVVSMIGVLEHVQHPRDILTALQGNANVRYLYISVPLFSTCVFLEMVFPDVFQRQLSAGHTHLYSESSLDWTAREFDMTRVAEWWFGTDLVDLYRSVAVGLESDEASAELADPWRELIVPVIDEMQMVLDRRKLSSEVHMLLRFDR